MESKGLRDERERAKNELRETGRALGRSRVVSALAEWGIRFLLGAVLAGGEVLSGAAPFGLAFVGAAGAGSGGFSALAGVVLGYLLSRGLESGLRYAAGSILVFSAAFAFCDLNVYKKAAFMPLVTGLINAVTGFVTLSARPWTASRAAGFVGEIALTVVAVSAFRGAFSLWRGEEGESGRPGLRQRLGLAFLGLAALVSLAGVELLGGLSVGRILAALCALWAGSGAGAGAGAAAGLAGGLTMDLTAAEPRIYAVSYALSGLCAGMLRGRGKLWQAAGFVLAGSLAVLWSWDALVGFSAVWETALAAVLFLLLPRRVLDQGELLLAAESKEGEGRWAYQAALRRLGEAAGAFGEVFSTLRGLFDRPADNGEDPCVIYDRAANRVCVHCPLRDRCWQSGYQDTYDLLNNALPGIMADAQARPDHFPQRFRDRCVRFAAFHAAVNEELSALLLRRRYRSRVGQSRRAVCSQYGDMARLLQEAAAAMAAPLTEDVPRTRRLRQFLASRELDCRGLVFFDPQGHLQLQLEGADAAALVDETARQALASLLDVPLSAAAVESGQVTYHQLEPLTAVAGVAGRKRQGQSVSGDACGWFKDEGGRLYILLCDGMGSGREARQDSDTTLRLLEKFLRAGVGAQSALKTLDQALCLREEETGSFSTVDLLELDLYEGKGCLYKLGAAPSYLKRGGSVKRLVGQGLPAGLGRSASTPGCCAFQMAPGDCLVLVTDGVAEEDDGWLRDALAGFDGGSPAALAEALVAHGGQGDDKTALVVRVGLRVQGEAGEGKAAV